MSVDMKQFKHKGYCGNCGYCMVCGHGAEDIARQRDNMIEAARAAQDVCLKQLARISALEQTKSLWDELQFEPWAQTVYILRERIKDLEKQLEGKL